MPYEAEGYATAATTHEATGQTVTVAFNASNLKAVALALRQKYPDSPRIIAADNDQWTEGNPGLGAAQEVAQTVNGTIIFPTFTEEAIARFKAQRGKGPTDFNDLHQLEGLVDDEDTVQLLRAFMAALIRGPAKYQRFLHLIGPGGSGKSTFIRLLQMMTGQKNTVSTDLRQLEQNRFE